MFSRLILFILIFIVVFILFIWIYFICKAVLLKVRNVPRRHLKAWVPPLMSGMLPGRSSEMLFTPLPPESENDFRGSIEPPTESVLIHHRRSVQSLTYDSDYAATRETLQCHDFMPTVEIVTNPNPEPRHSVFMSKVDEEDDWDNAKVTLNSRRTSTAFPEIHTTQAKRGSIVNSGQSTQFPAVIPSTNETIRL